MVEVSLKVSSGTHVQLMKILEVLTVLFPYIPLIYATHIPQATCQPSTVTTQHPDMSWV